MTADIVIRISDRTLRNIELYAEKHDLVDCDEDVIIDHAIDRHL